MKSNKIKLVALVFCSALFLTSCDNDDTIPVIDTIAMSTCDDGIMNGEETDIDCGGTCTACEEPIMMDLDFSGTYAQADHLGRPGINTVLSFDMEGQASVKDAHNVTTPLDMYSFQAGFQARLEQYHDVYATLLGLNPDDVNYEPNILGDILNGPDKDGTTDNPVSAEVLTTLLSYDVLEVAPDVPTTYFNGGAGAPGFEGAIGLTGRTPQDDVIDISLILLFGGATGDRFSGQDTNGDGDSDLPRLTSDGVGLSADIGTTFPYLGSPE